AGELLGGRVGEGLEYLVGGELAHLLRRGVGELAPAVPDVAVPEAGEGVQVGTPVRVEDPGAVTPGDRDGVPGQAGHVREPVPQRWLACGITRSWHHRASFPRWRQSCQPTGDPVPAWCAVARRPVLAWSAHG